MNNPRLINIITYNSNGVWEKGNIFFTLKSRERGLKIDSFDHTDRANKTHVELKTIWRYNKNVQ